jgi:hypothetical protein
MIKRFLGTRTRKVVAVALLATGAAGIGASVYAHNDASARWATRAGVAARSLVGGGLKG